MMSSRNIDLKVERFNFQCGVTFVLGEKDLKFKLILITRRPYVLEKNQWG
jgi:hypothetical protein